MALNIDLDQFYTHPDEVDKCFEAINKYINIDSYGTVIEPSAGTGAFFSKLPVATRIGLDLDPKMDGIMKMDFFDYCPNTLQTQSKQPIIAIGNPPYGRAGNLAVKFVNRLSEYCDYVCMVLPRSFRKYSIQNRIDLNMWLIHEHLVENFVLPDGTIHKVNSVFQIWEKRSEKRDKIKKRLTTDLWQWVSDPKDADCAMIFFGTPTGRLKTDNIESLTPSTHMFMKSSIPLQHLVSLFDECQEEIRLTCKSSNTAAGSLSKGDVIEIVEKKVSKN